MASSTNIKVVCRFVSPSPPCGVHSSYPMYLSFRPTNAIESREGGEICVSFDSNLQTVQLRSTAVGSGPEKDGFTFDRVFTMGTKQHELFDYGVKE